MKRVNCNIFIVSGKFVKCENILLSKKKKKNIKIPSETTFYADGNEGVVVQALNDTNLFVIIQDVTSRKLVLGTIIRKFRTKMVCLLKVLKSELR